MTETEIAELLAALRAGRLSLDEVSELFKRRSWVVARRPIPRTYAEMAAQQDVDGDVAGSFDEIVAAYDRGELTRAQYRTLAHAVADALNEGPTRDG
ncbi:MAG TPA: hypothetical protein VEV45_00655 [Streptosporangiaceae bacterium]|nr:hypothetical protein [Streptosporangiaceae bacterium]